MLVVQVLGAGGGCKDALFCIHLNATSVRVPGMVASWSRAEKGESLHLLGLYATRPQGSCPAALRLKKPYNVLQQHGQT